MSADIVPAEARFAVELFYDPESRNWGFEVPSLGIIGGGATRAAALRQARDAIAFTLEGDVDSRSAPGVERVYLRARLRLPVRHSPA
ncbi:MAG: type II toxin-antitoxin system HicB family antitoxin [Candidatus Dormibacteria bacterium]